MEILSSSQLKCFLSIEQPANDGPLKNPQNSRINARVSARTSDLAMTHKPFDKIPVTDTYTWNHRIQAFLRNREIDNVISTYQEMLLRGVVVDKRTLPRILTASRLSGDLVLGKQVHGQALKLGLYGDHYVVSSLIDMYGCLDGVEAARSAFDKSPWKNSVSWTVLARLYLAESKPRLAIDLFKRMVKLGAEIDSVAVSTALVACGRIKSAREGRKVYETARKCGLESDVLVGNSILQMFIDCGCLKDARENFDRMPSKDVVSWTAMIRGYVKSGGFNEGLKLFRQMNMDGTRPDALTIATVLPASARMTACKHGKEIHGFLIRHGVELNLKVQNALMDMYVKSGFIDYAAKVFATIKKKDTVSWTVMISGYSLYGDGKRGVDLFQEMEKDPTTKVDELAYSSVLHACATARMVESGKSYFNCIGVPKDAHRALMTSLLSNAGLFDEAASLVDEWQLDRSPEMLRRVLDGCRAHRDVKRAKRLIVQLCELEPLNADNYVLLSNWYAHHKKWDMVGKYQEMIRDMGLKPQKAYSWIEHRNKVHVFGTGDVVHPRSEGIYWELKQLMAKMDNAGERANLDFSLHDVDEEHEGNLIGHSEMLAVSFGLISKQAGTTIRVTKNRRICHGCHDALRAISRLVGREIIVRDPWCFHHFKDGFCSCG